MRYSQAHLYHNLVWEVCQNMLINDTIKLKINCFGSSEQIFSTEQHSQVTIIHIVSTTMLKYCVFYQNERAWLTGSTHYTRPVPSIRWPTIQSQLCIFTKVLVNSIHVIICNNTVCNLYVSEWWTFVSKICCLLNEVCLTNWKYTYFEAN